LELDIDVMKKNVRFSLPIAISGIAVPFAIGIGASFWLYDFNNKGVFLPAEDAKNPDYKPEHLAFVLFMGASLSFTAFPVLAAILTSARLLNDQLGVLALSTAAFSDVIAWCVLAFVNAFAHSVRPIYGLYTCLIAILYIFVVFAIVKPALSWIHDRSYNDNFHRFVSFYILILLLCAYFAQSIGIHAFFGSFIAGIVIPKQGTFVAEFAPKLEVLVVDFLLPLYFVSSGLHTDLQSADGGITVALIIFASVGKFFPCTLATKLLTKKDWNYCVSLGVLMNTRGLVELIALNIGLNLGVLSQQLFSMLVIVALITTFMSAPLVHYIYIRPVQVDDGKVQPLTHAQLQEIGMENIESTTNRDGAPAREDMSLSALAISHNPYPMTTTLEEHSLKSKNPVPTSTQLSVEMSPRTRARQIPPQLIVPEQEYYLHI